MHKSRLSAIGLDCQEGDLDAHARFWSAALGRPTGERSARYVELKRSGSQLTAFVQRVDHPSRVHIDIETDDVEAEVARLEALGAKRVEFVKRWWILEAPTGHRFCVVPVDPGETMGPDANSW